MAAGAHCTWRDWCNTIFTQLRDYPAPEETTDIPGPEWSGTV